MSEELATCLQVVSLYSTLSLYGKSPVINKACDALVIAIFLHNSTHPLVHVPSVSNGKKTMMPIFHPKLFVPPGQISTRHYPLLLILKCFLEDARKRFSINVRPAEKITKRNGESKLAILREQGKKNKIG